MSLDKLKRIIGACVVGGVLLLFVLATVLIYQLVLVGNAKKDINALRQEIYRLEQENSQTEDEIARWTTEWQLEERARELGYLYPGDK